jgi:hypothetical protein
MRDLDATTTRRQWVDIIARRTALLIQAAQRVGEAIQAGAPAEQISALRREGFEALIRLCEASCQDIAGQIAPEFRREMERIEKESNYD